MVMDGRISSADSSILVFQYLSMNFHSMASLFHSKFRAAPPFTRVDPPLPASSDVTPGDDKQSEQSLERFWRLWKLHEITIGHRS